MSKQKMESLLLDAVDLVHLILKESLASEELRMKLIKWRQEAEQVVLGEEAQ